tara:strand:- start:422 stop:931 length:510 start_codon:yes stop_codon:yes gene_type:complete
MLNKSRPVYKLNLKKQLKNKKEELIKDILNSKHKDTGSGYNFRLFTKYKDYLYNLFIKESKKILNPFTFKDKNFKVWCYFSGPADHRTLWHSHTKTANINCVIYLQTIKDYGVEFELYQQAWYVEPKNFDMLIFPGFLSHRPMPSSTQQRISLNLELRCEENEKDIFGL